MRQYLGLLGLLMAVAMPCIAEAEDWGSCSFDLEALQRAARDAAWAAQQADSAQDALQSCRDELRWSRYKSDCDTEADEYRSALRSLELEFMTLSTKLRSVNLTCNIAPPPKKSEATKPR